jgi:hypothetical protein
VSPDGPATTPVPVLEIEGCEVLPSDGGFVTLGISGRWANAAPGVIQLYMPGEGFGSLIDALPPGTQVSEDGEWSAAFEVDATAVSQRLALVPAVGRAVAFRADELVAEPCARCAESERALTECREKLVQAWRELEEARTALSEQQARYAALAGAAEPEAPVTADEKPWTALDEVLLKRLARAKQFTGAGEANPG